MQTRTPRQRPGPSSQRRRRTPHATAATAPAHSYRKPAKRSIMRHPSGYSEPRLAPSAACDSAAAHVATADTASAASTARSDNDTCRHSQTHIYARVGCSRVYAGNEQDNDGQEGLHHTILRVDGES